MKYIPAWARKLGLAGSVFFLLLVLARFAVEAILEAEVQEWWQSYAKPLLSLPIEFKIQLWHLLTAVLVIAATLAVYFFVRKPPRLVNGRLNPYRIRSPKAGSNLEFDADHEFDKVDVIRGWTRVKDGSLGSDDFATMVERAVNSGTLKSEVGAELLEEFGYELVLRSDKSYAARKKRRRA
jgi:hypothetical protein